MRDGTRRLRRGLCALVGLGVLAVGMAPSVAAKPGPRPGEEGYQLVTPRPGMANVHPIGWDRYERRGPRVLRVFFWSGVEPCSVLDHVTVEETRSEVRITLYEGTEPDAVGQPCIAVAVRKAVDVRLSRPLGGRTVVDGAESPPPADGR